MRYALIDELGTVVNIIEYDGKAQFDPGPGLTIRKATLDDEIVRPDETPSIATLDNTTADALREALSGAGTIEEVKTAILDVLAPEESQRKEV